MSRRKEIKGFDVSALTDAEYAVLAPALIGQKFPSTRIKRFTGKTVPITVADTSRWNQALDENGHGHVHVHNGEQEEHAHLLGEPGARRVALGLYWLPTAEHPAGRVEVGYAAMRDADLAREVLLAEAAHAVDYGALPAEKRATIEELFDYRGKGNPPQGWFEELGEQDYWRWRGERWMGLFMAAFAPEMPRPLEGQQPWEWGYDEADVRKVRSLLRRP